MLVIIAILLILVIIAILLIVVIIAILLILVIIDRGENKIIYGFCLHFSICACHPCAGAMLIFSVSFQF